ELQSADMVADPCRDRHRPFEIGRVDGDEDRAAHGVGQTLLSVATRCSSSVAGGGGGGVWAVPGADGTALALRSIPSSRRRIAQMRARWTSRVGRKPSR